MIVHIPAYPNLLQPGSPVLFSPEYVERYHHAGGIAFNFGCDEAHVTWGENHRPALIPLSELSLDLTTDTGMCHAARWLAGKLGMEPVSTAPIWRQGYQMGMHSWFLECPKKGAKYPDDRMDGRTFVYATENAAEAMRLACLAVVDRK